MESRYFGQASETWKYDWECLSGGGGGGGGVCVHVCVHMCVCAHVCVHACVCVCVCWGCFLLAGSLLWDRLVFRALPVWDCFQVAFSIVFSMRCTCTLSDQNTTFFVQGASFHVVHCESVISVSRIDDNVALLGVLCISQTGACNQVHSVCACTSQCADLILQDWMLLLCTVKILPVLNMSATCQDWSWIK